jgi:hypothetical protein
MMSETCFLMSPSGVVGRGPEIDATDPEITGNYDWVVIEDICTRFGDANLYEPIDVPVRHPKALSRDLYKPPCYANIISPRFRGLIEQACSPCFEFLPCFINSSPYWLLRLKECVDVLDRQNTVIDLFSDGRIASISKAHFFVERLRDEQVFSVPEDIGTPYVTRAVKEKCEAAKLKGVSFLGAESGFY